MFEREAHRVVLTVLRALRADVLRACKFLFGGGTRIVLDLDEYRESKDVDFLCSDPQGYAELRFQVSRHGYPALFTSEGLGHLQFPREMRIDQYGIRFTTVSGETPLRVELIREARIMLDDGEQPSWSPVACLSLSDCYAEKLLANSDRWADRQILSRDLVDLAALRAHCGPIPQAAWRKVEEAYKAAAVEDLRKAVALFTENVEYQRRCFMGLELKPSAPVQQGVELLRQEASASPTRS
ncbi:MAG TPA: nucleotidyl transferase AbiEii/AbiGii toxin family protein [Thermoanaerobaculia bacterium]|nr:nucleotidyl transferase AbiEii/AbiGii toxin family protein [Thermoanaerobaculia bacterium]